MNSGGWLVVSSRQLSSVKEGDTFTLCGCRRRRTDRLARMLGWFGIALYLDHADRLPVVAVTLAVGRYESGLPRR